MPVRGSVDFYLIMYLYVVVHFCENLDSKLSSIFFISVFVSVLANLHDLATSSQTMSNHSLGVYGGVSLNTAVP